MAEYLFKELSYTVVGALYSVHNILGPGLLESAYEGALVIECRRLNLAVEQQKVYPVYYKGELAGAYIADLVIEGKLILELKSVSKLTPVMEAQLINYLRLSGIRIGYLVNFNGSRVEFKRFVV